ncbi:MerR family transcriptional regulator [Actinoplanes subtropicus]|uniref:MerR family transcriptional regulator n=1 Tax=Actinoplanes subtropicus TaxID=543632 RepID=UPI0004C33F15|nr:MerR family transcriptional regulator [Actinoplanes subtropicus]
MWTLDELVERVREALAAEYPGAPNGRVRDVPDRRAIRWYTTIGLVDRPLGMRGRTALYGPRHLQQLVAIKRWQAEGRSLSQIQADFVFLTPRDLTEASRVPEHLLADDAPASVPDVVHRPRFWADRPATQTDRPATQTDVRVADLPAVESRPVETAPVHGVTLGGGAILLLPRPVTDKDRADIAAAAAPLMSLLETRGLIDGSTS